MRSDYLAIATLGIAEILIFVILKNEDWLTRGVKNVTGLPRPVPYEVDLQRRALASQESCCSNGGRSRSTLAAIVVKLCYTILFALVV